MKSIATVYKIGSGPSSSHTVGPYRAAKEFLRRYPGAEEYHVTLRGSLALTGEGHGTESAIRAVLPRLTVRFDTESPTPVHPNTLLFSARSGGREVGALTVYSIGGGDLRYEGEKDSEPEIYPQKNFTEILRDCEAEGRTLPGFIRSREPELREYLREVWHAMEKCVDRGLETEGVLPGGLSIGRKAHLLYTRQCYNESPDITGDRTVAAYAYAASEENASGGEIVTAPTCGSCGVLPAVLSYMRRNKGFPEDEILDALAVAGLIGNVIRTNASISGAECGCQAEIGSACSMAAGGLAALYRLSLKQIEYAAEVAMEHHLGLTCDPVKGLVQIPCIERNAVAAMRAIHSVNLSRFLYETRKISFDAVVATMYATGCDLSEKYRETARGGLASLYGS